MYNEENYIEKEIGRIVFFDDNRGWGFINGQHTDYFVHRTNVVNEDDIRFFEKGTKVKFIPSENFRGKLALGVELV